MPLTHIDVFDNLLSGSSFTFQQPTNPKEDNHMSETFAKGDKVRLKKKDAASGLSAGEVYTVGVVQDLFLPNGYYVDRYYWNDPKWSWARNKTRLQVAGHPQAVFLDGVLRPEMEIPPMNEDPEGQGRCSFSGAWFEKVPAS